MIALNRLMVTLHLALVFSNYSCDSHSCKKIALFFKETGKAHQLKFRC